MLLKSVLNVPGDYEKTLRLRRGAALALLAVGITGVVCYFCLVAESDLPDFVRGFYLGAASGILAGAIILLIRCQYLLTHPEAREKAQVTEQDERNQAIVHRAFQLAGTVTFFGSAAALFVVLPLSRDAFCALFFSIIVYSVAWVAGNLYYTRTM